MTQVRPGLLEVTQLDTCPGWDCCKQGSHLPWLCLPMAWQTVTHRLSPLLCCLSKLFPLLFYGGKCILYSVVLSLTKTFHLSLIGPPQKFSSLEDAFHNCCSVLHLLCLKRNISTEVPEMPPGQATRIPMFWNLCSTCVLLAVPGNAIRSMGKLRGPGVERFEC